MRLLFITQKIHENDDDLAFTILWVEEFIKQGFDVEVICLEKGDFSGSFPIHSLGKEKGVELFGRTFRFLKLIFTLKYDRVFVHMNPEYFTIGGWWWALRGTPSYLWYTHYTMTIHLWLAGIFAKYLFAATPQSLPQYEGNSKKVILGHGIDVSFWGPLPPNEPDPYNLISVHRLSRSKRLGLVIEALALLPEHYTLTVYGRAIDPTYFQELKDRVSALALDARVSFMGPVPMSELRSVYPNFRLMVNMASETIDKTMLEGMLFGIYPVTTPGNTRAIGLPRHPTGESPNELAEFIESKDWQDISREQVRKVVVEQHSLSSLISSIGDYIRAN